MRTFNFEKDQLGDWYVVLPEWEGDKSDLQMVLGADNMLDILAQGEDTVRIGISTDPDTLSDIFLQKTEEDDMGATYNCFLSFDSVFEVWLCNVTKFVFGEFPDMLFIKKK